MSDIAVILHTTDYRGDHSADVRRILVLPGDTTLQALQDRVESESIYGSASIEIVRPERAAPGQGGEQR